MLKKHLTCFSILSILNFTGCTYLEVISKEDVTERKAEINLREELYLTTKDFTRYHLTRIMGDDYANRVAVAGPQGQAQEIGADGIYIEKALIPNSEMVADLVDLDAQGRIKIDARNRTSVPGIFAAGDVTNTYAEQVLVAAGEGAKATLSAFEYVLPTL